MKVYVVMKSNQWEGSYIQTEHVYTDKDVAEHFGSILEKDPDNCNEDFYVQELNVKQGVIL